MSDAIRHPCFTRLDDYLANHNGRLHFAFQITKDMDVVARLTVETEKIDKAKRKPVPAVVATHCPFCGEKL